MTDFTPAPDLDTSNLNPSQPERPPKPTNKVTPWVLTLFLHGLIFAGAYVLYQRAVQSNQALSKTTTTAKTASSATAITTQKEVLQTLRDSSTPIAINQETYAPAPKVRSDLPVLTTADIIAQGNAIRAALNGDKADSAVSATALTALSVASSTTLTTKIDSKTTEKTTTIMMDASDEALTDRDLPAKERKNGAKTNNTAIEKTETKTSITDKKGTSTTKNTKLQKTDQAHQNSTEADQLSKELETTNADLSRNIDIVKNKNRQKIAKEFNVPKPAPSADNADDSLHSEDVPSKK